MVGGIMLIAIGAYLLADHRRIARKRSSLPTVEGLWGAGMSPGETEFRLWIVFAGGFFSVVGTVAVCAALAA